MKIRSRDDRHCGGYQSNSGRGVYSANNLADLPHQPVDFTRLLANRLLDVLEKYSLAKNFGVVGLHSHVSLCLSAANAV
ncbi:hypothetical protein DFH07DRAFT_951293 [Mycena maculata]|uniref:Uncharacterized protein n=1 Tax=Mycena maculata TaxID=230809 RepID=A0AAD7NVL6_9AGAR|nr:hypothetical protein DFH07DRAFT_951293 [Mycena maculata]